jgi:2'-5' RNA ligase
MHGLVSLLPNKYYKQVEEIWQELENDCGLSGIRVTPFPHFSWLIAKDFDWATLEQSMKEVAEKTRPFSVNTGGIELFSGPNPVIFIPIRHTAALRKLHQCIWDAIQLTGINLSPYYAPPIWTPHISLAYTDVTRENIGCAMQKLAFQTFNWEFEVNNISLIYEPDGKIGQLRYRFDF